MSDPFSTPFDSSTSLSNDTTAIRNNLQQATDATAGFRKEMTATMQVGTRFGSTIGSAFEGLVLKGRSLGDTVKTLGQQLSSIAFRAAFKPLEQAIGSGFNSFVGSLSGGIGSGTTVLPGFPGSTQMSAKGGVIASPMAFPLGQGTGIAGERGAEAIMPLARGPDGSLGVAASGTGNPVNVTFNVTATDAESFRRSESQLAALLARTVSRGQRDL